jgi:hypothetical protein
MHPDGRLAAAVLLSWACLLAPAWAAGGHHAVDDATILEPGQCDLETWVDRESGGPRKLVHLGPACRIGAIEVGLNFDHSRPGADIAGGAQIKWAMPLTGQISVGVLAAANWSNLLSHYGFTSIVLPLSWQASEEWLFHVNLGRDFRAGTSDVSRAGVAAEWSPNASWTAVAERWREGGFNYERLGGRWNVTPAWSVDLSKARSTSGVPPSWWTLGVTVVFGQ